MIIRCQYCRREFDRKSQLRQHERDAHPPEKRGHLLSKGVHTLHSRKEGK